MNTENQPIFSITPAARHRLSLLIKEQPKGSFMRISVLGGGCSGFEYKFEFDQKKDLGDHVVIPNTPTDSVCVVIDEISLPFLKGATLDFIDILGKTKFQINNPQAQNSCGCGNSFSV